MSQKPSKIHPNPVPETATVRDVNTAVGSSGDYGELVLDRARMHWQFGDWGRLVELDRAALYYHPDRRELALLAAAGHLQQGNLVQGRQMLELAQEWGCAKPMIAKILIAGVYNSLAKASAMGGEQQKSRNYFQIALAVGMPERDHKLLVEARANLQFQQLGVTGNKVSFSLK